MPGFFQAVAAFSYPFAPSALLDGNTDDLLLAYALTLIDSTYTGNCIRVRRASDNAEQDIGFNGINLDTAALATFCSGTNGFVRTIYDQSPNGNDGTQNSTSLQPKIYDSINGLELENSLAAIKFSLSYFTVLNSQGVFNDMHNGTTSYAFVVAKAGINSNPDASLAYFGNNATSSRYIGTVYRYDDRQSQSRNDWAVVGISNGTLGYWTSQQGESDFITPNAQLLHTVYFDADNVTAAQRSGISINDAPFTQTNTDTNTRSTSNASYEFAIGSAGDGTSRFIGSMQALIIYTADKSSELTTIKSKINNYYNIYRAIVTDGLIFRLDANESASYPGSGSTWYDTAGNNNGTLTNGASFSTLGGKHIEFDGVDDYIELGSITSDNPISLAGSNSHTIEIWFRGDATGNLYQRIIDKSTGGNAADGWAIIANDTPANDTRWTYIINGTVVFSTEGIWNSNTWYHMVLTHDGTSVKVYRNTVNVASNTISVTPPSTTANMRIGSWNHSTGREFKGGIGAVRIYDRVLTTTEIEQNYNETKSNYGL